MKRKLLFALLVVASFVGSFILANHFDNKNLNLPIQLTQGLRWIESWFSDEEVLTNLTSERLASNDLKAKLTTKIAHEKQYSHVEVGNRPVCKDTSLGKIQYKKIGDIYTWTDENDLYHVSDKPPEEGKFKLFNYAGEKVFDYFSLDLNTEHLPYDFNEKLTVKLNKLFEMYGKLLDVESLRKVDINLRVHSSESDFEQLKKQYNISSALGFYSGASNQAHILFINNDRTMRTAAHEATHAVNRAVIGYTSRWLNEGLAEYSEYINVKGMSSYVYPSNDWTRNGRISKQLLPLNTLFTANDEHWDSNLRQRLYSTSWAFIYFMMENPTRKAMLAKIIRSEQQSLCDVLSKEKIKQELGGSLNLLQRQFSNWSRSKLKAYSI